MPKLTADEQRAFLDEPGVLVRIATVRADGSPHVTPAWFIHDEGMVKFTPRAQSAWLADLRRDPRVALTIDEEAGPYRKVTVQGVARVLFETGDDDAWRDLYRRIAGRYIPEAAAERYVQETIDQPRALIGVPLAGSKVQTWRMPLPGEDYAGIWHQRYYVPGSKLARSQAADTDLAG